MIFLVCFSNHFSFICFSRFKHILCCYLFILPMQVKFFKLFVVSTAVSFLAVYTPISPFITIVTFYILFSGHTRALRRFSFMYHGFCPVTMLAYNYSALVTHCFSPNPIVHWSIRHLCIK